MKKFFKEFSTFIKRGNALDLAIGIVIGGAFQKIVSSLVNDIIMPLISMIGGVNIAKAKYIMKPAVTDINGNIIKPEIALLYGSFIQTIIDFLIIALAIFVAMKVIARFSKSIEKAKQGIGNIIDKFDGDDKPQEVNDNKENTAEKKE